MPDDPVPIDVAPAAVDRSTAGPAPRPSWHVRMQTGLSVIILFVVIALSATILAIVVMRTGAMIREASFHYVSEASKRAVDHTVGQIKPVQGAVDILAASAAFRPIENAGQMRGLLPQFRTVLEELPQLYSVYVGFDDGSWFQLTNLESVPLPQRRQMNPPAGAIYRATTIAVAGGKRQTTRRLFLDGAGEFLEDREDPTDSYDPRVRPWYVDAFQPTAGPITDIYMSYYLRAPLYTVRAPLKTGVRGVIAADILLTDLNRALNDVKVGKTGVVFLFDEQGRLVAHPRMAEMLAKRRASNEAPPPRIQDLGAGEHIWIVDNWMRTGRTGYEIDVNGREFVVSFADVPLYFATPTYLAVIAPEDEFLQDIKIIRLQAMLACVAVVALAMPLVWWLGRAIAHQIRALAQENERIRHFDIDQRPWNGSHITEIDELGRSTNLMKSALSAFGRFVPKQLVRRLIERGERLELGGRRQEVTILFTDIREFSTIADAEDPERLMRYVSRYFAAVTDEIMRHDGTVDKFIGDAVMAFWNAPSPQPGHAGMACAAVLACRDRIAALNREFAAEGWPAFATRFGLHTGEAIVGNVGSSERMSYTAMGSTVNIAARLEQLNKEHGTEILVSDALRQQAAGGFAFRRVGDIVPKGLARSIEVFELTADLAHSASAGPHAA